jgi:4-amino-4-deoxy-L-arabinose transferase-like glycosyltransferase
LQEWLTASVDRFTQGLRPYLIIVLTLLVCALPGLVALPPLDRDESRFAQATTQMFESGDFIRISFQDEPRNKKPVGIHWLQAGIVAAADPLGAGADQRMIQVFRLPSLLGALLCALSVFHIGARLVSRRVGLLGALAIACGLLLSTEAGIAKTDAALAGFTALAFWGLACLRTQSAKQGAWLFWTGVAAATLIKGPVGPLIIVLSIASLSLWERNLAWLKGIFHPPALLLAALIVIPWHLAIWQATDGQFFFDAIGQDLAPKVAGQSETPSVPPGTHFVLSPLLLWPGSILIPAALWAGWVRRFDPAVRFFVCWVVPGWLLFEATPAKLAHYTLPVHGGIVLLGAIGLQAGAWANVWVRWLGLACFALGGLVMAALPIALIRDLEPDRAILGWTLTGLIAGSVLATLGLLLRRSMRAAGTLLVCGAVASLSVKGIVLPNLAALNVSRNVSQTLVTLGLHPRLSAGQPGPLIGAGYQEPSLIFLTRSDSALANVATAQAAAVPGSGIVVSQDQKVALERALAVKGLSAIWYEGRDVVGVNYSKGDPVRLVFGRVSAASVQ